MNNIYDDSMSFREDGSLDLNKMSFMDDGSLNLNMIYADSQGLKRLDGTIIKDFKYRDLYDKNNKIKLNILVYDELCRRYDAYAANSLEERYIFDYEKESIFLGTPHRMRGIKEEDEFDDYDEDEYDNYEEEEEEEEDRHYDDSDDRPEDDSLLDDLLLLAMLEDEGSLDDF